MGICCNLVMPCMCMLRYAIAAPELSAAVAASLSRVLSRVPWASPVERSNECWANALPVP